MSCNELFELFKKSGGSISCDVLNKQCTYNGNVCTINKLDKAILNDVSKETHKYKVTRFTDQVDDWCPFTHTRTLVTSKKGFDIHSITNKEQTC